MSTSDESSRKSRFVPRDILLALVLGPVVWGVLRLAGLGGHAALTAGTLVLVGTLWIREAAPLWFSSLLPLALLPAAGILPWEQAAQQHVAGPIFLFFGGFLLALGLEEVGLHRRFAMGFLRMCGDRAAAQVGGMLAVSMVLSMWISNTSSALLLLPVAVSLGNGLDAAQLAGRQAMRLRRAWILAVAWGASIGGVATPIGTPPNALLLAMLDQEGLPSPSFFRWMCFGLPLAAVSGLFVWGLLLRGDLWRARATLRLEEVGAWTFSERAAGAIFALAGGGWIVLGLWPDCPGLSRLDDAGVALCAGALMLLTPSRRGRPLLPWRRALRGMPWGILLLVGAGLVLGAAMDASGLSRAIGDLLPDWRHTSFAMLWAVALLCILASEVGSNTASAAVLLPILLAIGQARGEDPWPLLLAGTLGCSFGFMLPVSTPPNALAYATGRVRAGEMMRLGIVVDLFGSLAVAALVWLISRMQP